MHLLKDKVSLSFSNMDTDFDKKNLYGYIISLDMYKPMIENAKGKPFPSERLKCPFWPKTRLGPQNVM
jgi:hypothetical protein